MQYIFSLPLKKHLQEKWGSLSPKAKEIILKIMNEYKEYQKKAIEIATKKDPEFPKKMKQFIQTRKKIELSRIEREEREKELENFHF